jgi:hypothetical protein
MCNTPVEVQFTSAGCLNYPCRTPFGTAERHAEVNKVMEAVQARMVGLGATIVHFKVPEYDTLASTVSTSQFEARTVMDRYFAALGPNAPIKSFAELIAAKTSAVQTTLEAEFAVIDGMNKPTRTECSAGTSCGSRSPRQWPISISMQSSTRSRGYSRFW